MEGYFRRNGLKMFIIFLALAAIVLAVTVGSDVFLKRRLPLKYSEQVEKYAAEFSLDKYLVYAVISTESGFNATAESKAGARGLMQLMPKTAEWINKEYSLNENAENLFDPDTNIRLGCAYLSYLSKRFGGDERKIICAYNGGEGNVKEWMQKYGEDLNNIPYEETRKYLKKVTVRHEIYKALYS